MTIDTNELRRLAQAATPGPWYVTGKLTRYVEALIDGGLIQEVAACGPTKADGGYGPQQEANARLIAAANPAAISELLDRLEEAENDSARYKALAESALRIAKGWEDKCYELRAKVEEMEKQEPVAWLHESRRDSDVVTSAVKHVWGKAAVGSLAAYSIPLYLAPGAQPAPSLPEGWKKELFCIQHAMAMNNWDWESDASNDMKRAAYAAVVRLRAAALEPKS